MLNYSQIDALYGAPLNIVPKPQMPFKLTLAHLVGGIILGYIFYKGLKQISLEVSGKFEPKVLKEE